VEGPQEAGLHSQEGKYLHIYLTVYLKFHGGRDARLQKLPWNEVIRSVFNICTELASLISPTRWSLLTKAHLTDVHHTEVMHML
jgi:hypothetical protein